MLLFLIISSVCQTFIGYVSSEFTLKRGEYDFHVKGAQGGQAYINGALDGDGGKGAYISTRMHITENVPIQIIAGGEGIASPCGGQDGGYPNGGKSGLDDGGTGDDGSGSGGASSVIEINGEKILEAGGGSGGAYYMSGCPGGEVGYIYCAVEGDICVPKDDKTNGNTSGFGGDGIDHGYTPGSGGGGGYFGGPGSGNYAYNNAYWAVACSGSSYVNKNTFSWGYYTVETVVSGANEGAGNITINTIYQCKDQCADCSSNDICTKCTGIYSLTEDKDCVENCPRGQIGINNICKPCENNCSACTGSQSFCTECSGSRFLYENECIEECPTSFYGINNKCEKCDDNCLECSGTFKACTKCKEGMFLYENECRDKCPNGTYAVNNKCEKCDENCKFLKRHTCAFYKYKLVRNKFRSISHQIII